MSSPVSKQLPYISVKASRERIVLHFVAEKFPVLCTIEADTSGIARALQPRYGPSGNSYFYMEYDIVLLFGLTEMKAQISWKENVSRPDNMCSLDVVNPVDLGPRKEVR